MSDAIGPSFPFEIEAAGLVGAAFSWTKDGINYGDLTLPDGTIIENEFLTQAQRTTIAEIVAAHDPTKPAPPVVPQTVTRYQAEVVMRRHGLWDTANAPFAAMDDSDERKIAWLSAPTFNRASAAIAYAAAEMGIDAEQLDGLFIEAGQVE